jgi:nitroimidazol reductase NimA-like FMN-containing flavoprotein (pyridoxamine 5'-phosphate oxidase superfamily)
MTVTPHPPPTGDAATGSKLTSLRPKESWALVRQAALGRFAFVMEGWPLVMPVNYLVDGDDVVIRSDPGRKLTAARQLVQATLQVDSIDRVHRSGWSVLVFGVATAVDDSDEIARLDDLGLRSWAASDRAAWIRLLPVPITGRRLPRAWSYPDPIR